MSKNFTTEKIELKTTSRYIRQNTSKAMRGDIVRGLVELITNADDSYRKLENSRIQVGGGIAIEVERKRKGSTIRVRDRAEGMSKADIVQKLLYLGARTSGFESGIMVRGLHGRGARDIIALGQITYESIKDDEYTKLTLNPDLGGELANLKHVTNELREKLRLPKRNGTIVTLETYEHTKIPLHDSLLKSLSCYYSLRDICSTQSRKIHLVDLNSERKDIIQYKYPEGGDVVFDQAIDIDNYPDAKAHIKISKYNTPFERDTSPCREGILLKSSIAIHDCNHFGLEGDPLVWRFAGTVQCSFIDKLINEYDDREEKKVFDHPQENNMRILDPDRDGLIQEHPFTKALVSKIKKILSDLVETLKSSQSDNKRDVSTIDLNKKLEDLSKRIAALYKDELVELGDDEVEILNPGFDIDQLPRGLHVIPGGNHEILQGKKKTFSVFYVGNYNVDFSTPVKVTSDNNCVKVNKKLIVLEKNFKDSNVGKCNFTIEGIEENKSASITISYKEYQRTIGIKVIEVENLPELKEGLFFKKPKYHIIFGKEKSLDVFLKTYNKFYNSEVKFESSNSDIVILGGAISKLKPTNQRNLFKCSVKVEGRRKKASGVITAILSGFDQAITNVTVEERENSGINFEFEPKEEDYGTLRYKWDLANPSKLYIGAKHPSIRKYLGEPFDNIYPGKESPLYYSVIAEVIAEAVAFRLLEKTFSKEGEAKKLDYTSTETYYHKYFSKFLTIAHNCLLDQSKVERFFIKQNSEENKLIKVRQ